MSKSYDALHNPLSEYWTSDIIQRGSNTCKLSASLQRYQWSREDRVENFGVTDEFYSQLRYIIATTHHLNHIISFNHIIIPTYPHQSIMSSTSGSGMPEFRLEKILGRETLHSLC